MTDILTDEQRVDRIRWLLTKMEECEQECYALDLHTTGQLINGAKNGVGWGFAKLLEDRAAVGGAKND